jgi:glycosyltransferase involved in cell wall biosynthesis
MKISIITPSFNRVDMIGSAIDSVRDQNYPEVEHFIIDGGSTDGTLDLLKKYPHLRAVSEPDQGMYDALNKGVSMATGEIIGFLNSDDFYAKDAFQKMISIFAADPDVDIVWGSADFREIISGGEKIQQLIYSPTENKGIIPFLLNSVPIFNACFFHKQVFEEWGHFMEQLKISGDREFMIRLALGGAKFHPTDTILYHYVTHVESMTYGKNPENFEVWNNEHCKIAEFYLDKRTTQGIARKTYKQLHSISNLSLLKIAIKRSDYIKAIDLVIHGWIINPGWPLLFWDRFLKISK